MTRRCSSVLTFLLALLLAAPPARAEVGREAVVLEIEGCAGLDAAAVRRVLMAELGVRVADAGGGPGVEARVRCLPGFARVAVEAGSDRVMVRLVDLDREAPAARARVLALALVEAFESEPAGPGAAGGVVVPPEPTPRTSAASPRPLVAAVGGPRRAGGPRDDASRCVPREVYEAVLECPAGATVAGSRPAPARAVARRAAREAAAGPQGPGLPRQVVGRGGRDRPGSQPLALLRREVAMIRRLVEATPASSQARPARELRLAGSLVELSDALVAEARRLDEPVAEARRSARGRGAEALALEASRDAFEQEAAAARDDAIRQYTAWAERAGADAPERGWVLELLGSLFEEQAEHHGRRALAGARDGERELALASHDRARRVYEALLERRPVPPRALLFFARDAADRNDLSTAAGYYDRLGRSGPPALSALGFYEAAWVHVRAGRDRDAIAAFAAAIRVAAEHPESRDARDIARYARLELVGPWSRATAAAPPPRQAWRTFRRLGGDEPTAREMMERLARLYADQGRWAEALAAYRALVDDGAGSSPAARCVDQARAAGAVLRAAAPRADQAAELRRAAELMRAAAGPEAGLARACREAVAGVLVDAATTWHAEAVGGAPGEGTNDAEAMALATELYRLVLEALPDLDELELEGWPEAGRPTTYRVSYWLADLLYAREQWAECGPAYDRVVDLDRRPGAELLEAAAYGAVVCYDRLREASPTSTPATEGLARRELTAAERAALGAYSRYLCFAGDGGELARVGYRRAAVHLGANQLEEAALLFREVAYGAPTGELGRLAALGYLDALAAVGRLDPGRFGACRDDMERAVDDFLADERIAADAEAAAALARTRCGILWSRAEELAARGEYGACAELYLEIWDRWREPCRRIGDHGLDEVLHNAAVCLEADSRLGQSIQVRRTLIEEFGGSRSGSRGDRDRGTPGPSQKMAARALYEIGEAYQSVASFGRAAEAYEAYAAQYPAEASARDALQDATLFRMALGEPEKALADARLFERSFGRTHPAETATVLLAVGQVFLDRGQWREAGDHFRKMLATYGKGASPDVAIRARVGLGEALWKLSPPAAATRREALDSFERALALADVGLASAASGGGSPPHTPRERERERAHVHVHVHETVPARLERYRSMLGDGADATRLGLMVDAVARARFSKAEVAYERFAAIALPSFRPRASLPPAVRRWWREARGADTARSVERAFASMSVEERREWIDFMQVEHWAATSLGPWLDRRGAAQVAAMALYREAAADGVPAWSIAAAKRVGDMYRETMQALADAPLPEDLEERRGELIAQYRGSAIDAYESCLRESTRARWFSEWSRGCERALAALAPRDFPLADELHAEPIATPSPLAIPGPVRTLPESSRSKAEPHRE